MIGDLAVMLVDTATDAVLLVAHHRKVRHAFSAVAVKLADQLVQLHPLLNSELQADRSRVEPGLGCKPAITCSLVGVSQPSRERPAVLLELRLSVSTGTLRS